jgi:hypothetical protein
MEGFADRDSERPERARKERGIMAKGRREALIENLAVASAIGLLAVFVAAASFVTDSRVSIREGAALASTFSLSDAVLAGHVDDPCFERVFSARDGESAVYGTIISLRSSGSSILAAALFSPLGELRGLRSLGPSAESRHQMDVRASLGATPGAQEALDRAAQAVRTASRTPEAGS